MTVGGEDRLTNRSSLAPPPPAASYPESEARHSPHPSQTDQQPPPEGSGDTDEATEGHLDYHLGTGERFYVYRPPWRRPRVVLLVLLGVVLFFVPLAADGLWWLTLAVSVVVVGIVAVLAAPAHRPHAAVAAVVVALVAFVGLEAYNDVAFGTLSLSGPPPLIFACGSEYSQSSQVAVSVAGTVALHRVGTAPSGMELLGNARCGGPHSVWAFVAVGTGKVLAYLADHYTGQPVPFWR